MSGCGCAGCYDSCSGLLGQGGFGIGGYGGFGSYPGCGYKECGGCCGRNSYRFRTNGSPNYGVYRNGWTYESWGRNGTYVGPRSRYGKY